MTMDRPLLRKPNGAAVKLPLDWNTQGVRRRCPRMTWKRTAEEEANEDGRSGVK
jgi:hypothetical protein